MKPLLAIVAAGLLVATGYFVLVAPSTKDPLQDAASGVVAHLIAHLAFVTPTDVGGIDAAYVQPQPGQAASVFSSTTFALPLSETCPQGCSSGGGSQFSCANVALQYAGDSPLHGTGPSLVAYRVTYNGVGVAASGNVYGSYNGGGWTTYWGGASTNSNGAWSTTTNIGYGVTIYATFSYQGCSVTSQQITSGAPPASSPSPSPSPAPAPAPAPAPDPLPRPVNGQISLRASISGSIDAKNLASDPNVLVTFSLLTAHAQHSGLAPVSKQVNFVVAGLSGQVPGTNTTPAPVVNGNIPAQGAAFDALSVSDLVGDNPITITVTVTATDYAGNLVRDSQSLIMHKIVDGTGSVSVTIQPADITTDTIALDGSPKTVDRHDVPTLAL